MTTHSHWTDAFTPARFAAFLAALILANFAPVIFGGQSFFLRDFGYFSYPLAQFHRECFWRGELPLWNPYSNCGLPFLAQWNTLVLYPPSLIYLLLPMPWSFNLFCLLHLFVAGLGMYLLALSWTANRFAAAVAGTIFAFNGLALNCLMWSNNMAALALMPWVIFCAQRAWQNGGRSLCLAALVGALQMLTGAPEIIFLTWLFAGCLCLLDLRCGEAPKLRGLFRFVVLVAFIAALSAAQLLPFFDLLQASDRDAKFATGAWSMPPWGLANLFVPLFRSYPTASGVYFQRDQYWIASYYLGIGTLALALVAIAQARNTRVKLLIIFAILSVALAFGDNSPLYPMLRKFAPQLGFMRFPIKFVVLLSLVLPLLAAFGVHWLEPISELQHSRRTLARIAAVVGIVVLVIIGFARFYPGRAEDWSVTVTSGVTRLVIVAAVTILFAAMAKTSTERIRQALGVIVLLAIFFDGRTHSPKTNPTIPSDVLHAGLVKLDPPPSLGRNRAMLTRPAYDEVHTTSISDPMKDFLLHRQALFDNCNLLDRIPKTDGFFSLYLREQRRVWTEHWFTQSNYLDSPYLDFLGVAYVNTPNDIFDWTNRATALPLATAGQQPFFASADATLDGLLSPLFDPRRVVYLPSEAKGAVAINHPTEVQIHSQRWDTQRIQLKVTAKENSLLVLAQTFDHSWRARVDGKLTEVLRANHAFQAVVIPAGPHEVVFTYESKAFRDGAKISLASAAFLFLIWWNPISHWRSRNQSAG